jgi:hypothetical protein
MFEASQSSATTRYSCNQCPQGVERFLAVVAALDRLFLLVRREFWRPVFTPFAWARSWPSAVPAWVDAYSAVTVAIAAGVKFIRSRLHAVRPLALGQCPRLEISSTAGSRQEETFQPAQSKLSRCRECGVAKFRRWRWRQSNRR